ncbi:MAG: hypothetical protein K2X87_22765 [Gemmataceae bacterium]|nr:hypothetical protein [Gemmataceae bacterium]
MAVPPCAVLVVFGLLPVVSDPPPAAGGPPVPVPTLVRGKVTAVGPDQVGADPGSRSHVATIEVVHVYAGDKGLVGKTFTDSWATQSGAGSGANAPFKVGEVALWCVAATGPEGRLATSYFPGHPFFVRSREGSPRHARHKALAEAMEGYAAAKPGERLGVVQKLAADRTPEVAAWAVRTIGEYENPEAVKPLYDLAVKPDLPCLVQIALDEVLCGRDPEGWTGSKEQEKLLRGWVAGKADEYEAVQILSRLDSATQHQEAPAKLTIELTGRASANEGWPREARLEAVWRVGLLGHWAADDDPAFDWLLGQVRSNPDIEFRRKAANVIGRLSHFPARVEALEKQLAVEQDEKVATGLRESIQIGKKRE